jgi:hypothetical protein
MVRENILASRATTLDNHAWQLAKMLVESASWQPYNVPGKPLTVHYNGKTYTNHWDKLVKQLYETIITEQENDHELRNLQHRNNRVPVLCS